MAVPKENQEYLCVCLLLMLEIQRLVCVEDILSHAIEGEDRLVSSHNVHILILCGEERYTTNL